MVGRRSASLFPKTPAELGDVVLEVERLTRAGVFQDVVHGARGEIVCLAGLVGAGRSEIARAVFGVDRYDSGSVRLGGRDVRPAHTPGGHPKGMGFVPEDRRKQGLRDPRPSRRTSPPSSAAHAVERSASSRRSDESTPPPTGRAGCR